MNIPKEKAPNDLFHIAEYRFNDGYYFANCQWTDLLNSDCYYLKKGCTACKNLKTFSSCIVGAWNNAVKAIKS